MWNERIILVDFKGIDEYIPDAGYVIRDMKPAPGNKLYVWLQPGESLN